MRRARVGAGSLLKSKMRVKGVIIMDALLPSFLFVRPSSFLAADRMTGVS